MMQLQERTQWTLMRLNPQTLPRVAHLLTAVERAAAQRRAEIRGLAAMDQGVGIGCLLFSQQSWGFELQTLVVDPSYRRLGVGTALVRALCCLAQAKGLPLLVPFAATGFRDPIYLFLASLHCFALTKQPGFTAELEREPLEKACQRWQMLTQRPTEAVFDQRAPLLYRLRSRLEPSFPAVCRELVTATNIFDTSLSRCVVHNEDIRAVSLVQREGNTRHLRLLYAEPGNGSMAMAAIAGTAQRFLDETDCPLLSMTITTPTVKRLLDRLCGDYSMKERLYLGYFIGPGREEGRI